MEVQSQQLMSSVISLSNETFIFSEIKQLGHLLAQIRLVNGKEACLEYNKRNIEKLKRKTPNHHLIEKIIRRNFDESEQEKQASNHYQANNKTSCPYDSNDSSLVINQIFKQTFFWEKDNQLVDKFNELMKSPTLTAKTKCHSELKMNEYVICSHLIQIIRTSNYCPTIEEEFKRHQVNEYFED